MCCCWWELWSGEWTEWKEVGNKEAYKGRLCFSAQATIFFLLVTTSMQNSLAGKGPFPPSIRQLPAVRYLLSEGTKHHPMLLKLPFTRCFQDQH
ncbi:hypothetical protein CY35_02G049900 [Sphagnum magellanicum]|nr:hypothetical protein CY35_02G049900 [Sphagnum magellanicum]